MKNKTWRRDAGFYRFGAELQTRYADMDTERHVNNVAVQNLHAEGRSRLHLDIFGRGGWLPLTARMRPAAVLTDFIAVTHYPAPVSCRVGVVGLDERSYTLASALYQEGQCVGLQECRLGAWSAGGWGMLPAAHRERLAAFGVEMETAAERTETAAPTGLDAYPQQFSIVPRFGDLDADGLLGESALARFIEQARVQALDCIFRAAGMDPRRGEYGMLIAHVAITPRSHCAPAPAVSIGVGVTQVGRSSLQLAVAAFCGERCIATAENVMVVTRREDSRPAEIPPALRERLRLQWLAPAPGQTVE